MQGKGWRKGVLCAAKHFLGYGNVLVQAVKNGKVTEAQADPCVRRVMRDKYALGLFGLVQQVERPHIEK